jgi:ABC-type Fe3+-hydroxamate transport system substrate-binding protein
MGVYTDQMGREVQLDSVPRRIVSLVPSQTELLYTLGLHEEVVGITKFCVHPENWYSTKVRVGGTKNVDIARVKKLNPDLIIGNKEENSKADIDMLARDFPVWMSDIYNLKDALSMIEQVGLVVNKHQVSHELSKTIAMNFRQIKGFLNNKKVLYFIWKDPYLVAANNTFIHAMIEEELGGVNVVRRLNRYPEIDVFDNNLQPDIVLLSSEPYPFRPHHMDAMQAVYPSAEIMLVNGEFFSWYGSRLTMAPDYFRKVFHRY